MGFGYGAGTGSGSGLKDAWMRFLNVFKLPKRVEIMLMLYVRVPKAANKLNMYLSFGAGVGGVSREPVIGNTSLFNL